MNQKDAVEKIESMGDCDNCSYYRKVARDILFKVERLGHISPDLPEIAYKDVLERIAEKGLVDFLSQGKKE